MIKILKTFEDLNEIYDIDKLVHKGFSLFKYKGWDIEPVDEFVLEPVDEFVDETKIRKVYFCNNSRLGLKMIFEDRYTMRRFIEAAMPTYRIISSSIPSLESAHKEIWNIIKNGKPVATVYTLEEAYEIINKDFNDEGER